MHTMSIVDRAAFRARSQPSFSTPGRRTTHAVHGRVSSILDKRRSKPSSAKPSPAAKAMCDPEIMAWLNEAILYMPASEDRMPDPVTRLGFADTLAWGVKTLRTPSPLSSVFDPELSPLSKDQPSFVKHARLSENPDIRTKWPSSYSASCPHSSPAALDGNDSSVATTTAAATTMTSTTSSSAKKIDSVNICAASTTYASKAMDADAAKDPGDVLPSGRFRTCASLVAQRGNEALSAPMYEHSM